MAAPPRPLSRLRRIQRQVAKSANPPRHSPPHPPLLLAAATEAEPAAGDSSRALRVTITSELPADLGNIPFAPTIDFAALLRREGCPVDPTSFTLLDLDAAGRSCDSQDSLVLREAEGRTATELPVAVRYRSQRGADGPPGVPEPGDDSFGDSELVVEWAITEPSHRRYELRFRTLPPGGPLPPPPIDPRGRVPIVGCGDLLRYNSAEPRPITLATHGSRLLPAMGRPDRHDLVGAWNYYHRPNEPRGGLVCFPRTDPSSALLFGDMVRLHYRTSPDDPQLHHFQGTYTAVDFCDLTGDGSIDILFADQGGSDIGFFTSTGERDGAGAPIFLKAAVLDLAEQMKAQQRTDGRLFTVASLQAVDFDGDGRFALVANGLLIRNRATSRWPFDPAWPAIDLGCGGDVVMLDVRGDGRPDAFGIRCEGAPGEAFGLDLRGVRGQVSAATAVGLGCDGCTADGRP